MKKRRNIFIGFMAVAVVIAGIVLLPKTASAVDTYTEEETGIIYTLDETNYDFKTYWNEKKAPVMKGCVFGGWYVKEESGTYTALTEDTASTADSAYAKFVPDYVLSVRAQNEDGTAEKDGKNNSIRVLSSVDSKAYQSVGFDIWLANKTQITLDWDGKTPLTTNKIFEKIMVGENPVTPETYFGGVASKYFSVWRLDEIVDANDSKIIYVRPYWTTLDGTKVEGLAKYVHVEDQYKNYISVPINLMTGEAIAAGVVEMNYSGLTFVGFEEGRLLKEMEVNYGTSGVVKMVGNAETANQEIYADGIYANLRFVKPGTTDPNTLITEPEEADFANWDEEEVAITPIIQY